jgi:hypothetical protein
MKNTFKLLAIAIFLCGLAVTSYAQVTLNSSASATIVTTMGLTKNYDLDFGNLAVTTVAGTCILTPMAGPAPTRSITGGVTLPGFVGTPRAAEFIVTGVANQAYTINIPLADLTITHTTVPTASMIVNTYTTDQTVVTPGTSWFGTLGGSGDNTFHVGATVHVSANQLAGLYQSMAPAGGFPVTVNYQ